MGSRLVRRGLVTCLEQDGNQAADIPPGCRCGHLGDGCKTAGGRECSNTPRGTRIKVIRNHQLQPAPARRKWNSLQELRAHVLVPDMQGQNRPAAPQHSRAHRCKNPLNNGLWHKSGETPANALPVADSCVLPSGVGAAGSREPDLVVAEPQSGGGHGSRRPEQLRIGPFAGNRRQQLKGDILLRMPPSRADP